MKSVFVQEQKQYTKSELLKLFAGQDYRIADGKLIELIRRLKDNGGMKILTKNSERDLSELTDEEFVTTDDKIGGDDSQRFVFTFVGILDVDGVIIKSVPKYFKSIDAADTKEKFSTVLSVIKKYKPVEEPVKMATEDVTEKAKENLLSLLVYLFEDYLENGVYTHSTQQLEINGDGEILWDKTINETFAIISNNRPYYTEIITRKQRNDDYDYFKRLHECIITEISSELKDAQILDILGFEELELTEDVRDDFGDDDYICYRLSNELNVQFNTRKQLLLKAMYSYIAMQKRLKDDSGFTLFGTFSFNMVWEEVCRSTLRNVLEENIGKNFPEFVENYKGIISGADSIIKVIENPIWYDGDTVLNADSGKYRPDFLAIENLSEDEKCYIIYDAKYYNIERTDNRLSGQPGLESVTKQFMYHAVLKEFMSCLGIAKCFNIFLAPSDEGKPEYCGSVTYPFLTKPMNLEPVRMIKIPADAVYKKYLNGTDYSFENILGQIPTEDIETIEENSLYARIMKRKRELRKAELQKEIEKIVLERFGLIPDKSKGPLPERVENQHVSAISPGYGTDAYENNDNIIYLPVYTAISAGYGTDAFEDEMGYHGIDKSCLRPLEKGKYCFLKVKGDSMINAGINDGDLVLIRKTRGQAHEGEIVAVRVDNDQGLLKKFYPEEGQVRLSPENPRYDDIFISNEEFENGSAGIVGIVQPKHTVHNPEILSEDDIDRDKIL